MGDAPQKVEESLMTRYGNKINSTALKVGHHGSKTAPGNTFLNTVSPRYAIVCAGLRHGLSDSDALVRLEKYGAEVWRTDDNDADTNKKDATAAGDDNILITSDGKNSQPQVRWNRWRCRRSRPLGRRRMWDGCWLTPGRAES